MSFPIQGSSLTKHPFLLRTYRTALDFDSEVTCNGPPTAITPGSIVNVRTMETLVSPVITSASEGKDSSLLTTKVGKSPTFWNS
jgi:hypothetical protein